MFTNTGYEALYHYLGLSLQKSIRDVLVSESFFQGIILLIFGVIFFITTIKFFSRYFPGSLVARKSVPLSKFVWIIASLFLGLSLLRVSTDTMVKSYKEVSWHDNPYIQKRIQDSGPNMEVSLAFDILSKTAHEFSAFLSKIVDRMFAKTHSQLNAPDFFYKSIMYAGASNVSDPKIKGLINLYTEECIDKILPYFDSTSSKDRLFTYFFYNPHSEVNKALGEIALHGKKNDPFSQSYTCMDLKVELREKFLLHVDEKVGKFHGPFDASMMKNSGFSWDRWVNMSYSQALVNHYMKEKEAFFGIDRGSQVPGTAARVFQYLNKILSWDGIFSVVSHLTGIPAHELHGASLAAKRSSEFNELLARAPHVKGFITLILIAVFPLMVFPIVAGRWKWLVVWFLSYFSVLLWTPIWTLFYHLMTNLALASESLSLMGHLDDGISLYSSKVITTRIYYLYAIYSWLQIIIGPMFTGTMLVSFRPLLRDTREESAPEFIGESQKAAGTAAKTFL